MVGRCAVGYRTLALGFLVRLVWLPAWPTAFLTRTGEGTGITSPAASGRSTAMCVEVVEKFADGGSSNADAGVGGAVVHPNGVVLGTSAASTMAASTRFSRRANCRFHVTRGRGLSRCASESIAACASSSTSALRQSRCTDSSADDSIVDTRNRSAASGSA